MSHQQRIAFLFSRYYQGLASVKEIEELESLISEADENEVAELMRQAWQKQNDNSTFFAPANTSKIISNILNDASNKGPVIGITRNVISWKRLLAVAAVIAVVAFSAAWFLNVKKEATQPSMAVSLKKAQDLAPGGNKAILTLADGTRVILDSANNGAITIQGNVTVIKLDDGQLTYKSADAVSAAPVTYNTITTPRGGQYQLILSDGTKVWLNAASSLRFPAAFTGKERKVTLSGEGYFEVAHNKDMPFSVAVGDMNVKVLGTHFNVNAYTNEEQFETTLLQGSVSVTGGNQEVLLKPGQQAQWGTANQKLKRINAADVEAVVGWKNGRFSFHNMDLKAIMRQMARWYDVDVIYKDNINDKYTVTVPRNVPASQLFKFIEMSGGVHFEIDGGKVIVSK